MLVHFCGGREKGRERERGEKTGRERRDKQGERERGEVRGREREGRKEEKSTIAKHNKASCSTSVAEASLSACSIDTPHSITLCGSYYHQKYIYEKEKKRGGERRGRPK